MTSTVADELSRQAAEFARRAMRIQAGHLADVRRKTAIWSMLSKPGFDGIPDLTEPDEARVAVKKTKDKKKNKNKGKPTEKNKKKGKGDKKAKKAKKKDK